MASTFGISFTLDTSDARVPLGFEAWIDDQKFHDIDHVSGCQQILMEVPDDDGLHELRLIMKNKTIAHTRIDQAGNITADVTLTVKDMTFDEVALGHMFSEHATYKHDYNGTQALTQQKFYGEMGCNGTVSMKFNTPVYLWLLENI